MPRDPAKMKKRDLLAELEERHGIEQVELEVAEPAGFGEEDFEMPEDLTVRYVPDPDADPDEPQMVPVFVETVPLAEAGLTVDELVDRFGTMLDTTTEKDRQNAAREQVALENAAAAEAITYLEEQVEEAEQVAAGEAAKREAEQHAEARERADAELDVDDA